MGAIEDKYGLILIATPEHKERVVVKNLVTVHRLSE